MLPVLVIFLVIGVCSAIYWGFWYGTRTKLQNEEEKSDFLESKFKHLKNLEFKKDDIEHDFEIDKIIKIFNENGFKNGTIKEIICTLPYDEKKPWRVYASVKTGTWPFNDKEEDIEIFSIMDDELSILIES